MTLARSSIFALLSLVLTPLQAQAGSLLGTVSVGGVVVSDSVGSAEVAAGAAAEVSIFLDLAAGEDATFFQGVFDLLLGIPVVADPGFVELEWSDVAQHQVGSQSTWSAISDPAGGRRLVAHWLVMTEGASDGALLRISLAPGTFAGRDLEEDPFFENLPLDGPEPGSTLVSLTVVPEPSIMALSLVAAIGVARASRRRSLR